jgi:dTDP-glucose 4,6-dehydratase
MCAILITGGAGFIGSNFIKYLINSKATPNHKNNKFFNIINLDKLTYAGNLANLENIENLQKLEKSGNYHFIKGDINDEKLVFSILSEYKIEKIINFAAESHVDRSIENPNIFVQTNVLGTANLLSCAKKYWDEEFNSTKKNQQNHYKNKLFVQISTDEVYGSLPENEPNLRFTEETNLSPHSPYSASKAGADLLVQSFYDTYNFPTIITRCSNNFGPNQFPEKFIPMIIKNALQNQEIPIYGDGQNVRDWIFVDDHCKAIAMLLEKGKIGEIYNIGANCEKKNIEIAKLILDILGKPHDLLKYVDDRLGHDRRYAINSTKISNEINWSPNSEKAFEENIKSTIEKY